jgi:hypothetical protein
MKMAPLPCPRAARHVWPCRALAVGLLACAAFGGATPLWAQAPGVHYQHRATLPPGAIGGWRLRQGGPLPGYFQPVEVRVPEGARVALAAEGRFLEPQGDTANAGLLIGAVYRLRVTDIPLHEGQEVYPTLELIDRTYPPLGHEVHFPIVVDIVQDDLLLALSGKFVTRVIYLEDPERALPARELPRETRWFEVAPGEDPLQVADTLGRPMAILRLGGRVPEDTANPGLTFLYGSPPHLPLPPRQLPVEGLAPGGPAPAGAQHDAPRREPATRSVAPHAAAQSPALPRVAGR